MFQLISLLVVVALVVGCGVCPQVEHPNASPPSSPRGPVGNGNTGGPRPNVQEGIGGDLAALYVKSLTIGDMAEEDPRKKVVGSSPLFSTEDGGALFQRKDGVLFVSRTGMLNATAPQIVCGFLREIQLGPCDSAVKFVALPLIDLEEVSVLNMEEGIRKARDLVHALRSNPRPSASLAAGGMQVVDVDELEDTFSKMNFFLTNDRLEERGSKRVMDAVTQVLPDRSGVSYFSRERLSGMGRALIILPLLILHEVSHAALLSSGDRTYGITQELLGVWELLRADYGL